MSIIVSGGSGDDEGSFESAVKERVTSPTAGITSLFFCWLRLMSTNTGLLRVDPNNRIDITLANGAKTSLWWATKNEWLGLLDVAASNWKHSTAASAESHSLTTAESTCSSSPAAPNGRDDLDLLQRLHSPSRLASPSPAEVAHLRQKPDRPAGAGGSLRFGF